MQRCHSNSPSGWSFSGDVKLWVDIYFRLMHSVSEHPHIFSDLLAFLSKLCEDEKVGIDQCFGCQTSLFPTIFGTPIMPSPIAHRSRSSQPRNWMKSLMFYWAVAFQNCSPPWRLRSWGWIRGREIDGLRCLWVVSNLLPVFFWNTVSLKWLSAREVIFLQQETGPQTSGKAMPNQDAGSIDRQS